jgi:hypothetical protein|tara:strand:+ start:452 stop:646 length:195 start_codon:yes stop_codon:yes gene_type:complete
MRCEHKEEKNWRFVSFLKKMKKTRKKRKERGKKGGKPESNKKRVAKNLRSQIIRRCVFQSNENE